MTVFAAITTKNNTNKIIGFGSSKSACSRKANAAVLDPYGKRCPSFGEIHICEFESLTDAREYVAAMPKP